MIKQCIIVIILTCYFELVVVYSRGSFDILLIYTGYYQWNQMWETHTNVFLNCYQWFSLKMNINVNKFCEKVRQHHQLSRHEYEQTGRQWRTEQPGVLPALGVTKSLKWISYWATTIKFNVGPHVNSYDSLLIVSLLYWSAAFIYSLSTGALKLSH